MRRRGLAALLALLALAPLPALPGPSWDRGEASYVESLRLPPEGGIAQRPAWPVRARLSQPTDRYDHDILGGIPPWSTLEIEVLPCGSCGGVPVVQVVRLPKDMVFEDIAPRLWDVTGDGRPEVVVVETSLQRGARLAVWSVDAKTGRPGRLAATPFIGRPHRWLAPVAAADLDGDGRIEIAYVDRPHLARNLVILRLEGGGLREVSQLPGLTAHRIGDTQISAATRSCPGGRSEILLPDADWQRLMAVTLAPDGARARDIGALSQAALQGAARAPCRG